MMKRILMLSTITVLIFIQITAAAEWQYSISIPGSESRAWLWIPPACKRIKGIVMGQQVILEKYVLEHETVRNMAEENDLALLLVNPMVWTPKTGNESLTFIDNLAQISGYTELAIAPILTLGHSGGAIWAWHAAYCNPARIVAAIGLHASPIFAPEWAPEKVLDGVPVLSISGQYETWDDPNLSAETHWKWVRGAGYYLRGRYPSTLFTEIVEPGTGHFSFSERLSRIVSMYISKAFKYRLADNEYSYGRPVLRRLSVQGGWLTDTKFMSQSEFSPAPYNEYKGDKSLAFWCFDREMANAIEEFGKEDRGKLPQWLTFVSKEKPIPNQWLENLPFEPMADGMSVKLKAAFCDAVPAGIAGGGAKITHADGKIRFKLIGGWGGGGEQINDSTLRIRFSNFGMYRRADNLMVLAYHDGDAEHAFTEQVAQIKYSVRNNGGKSQTITFPPVKNIRKSMKQIELRAVSSSGLPVEYYVKHGPVMLEKNRLSIQKIPPRSKYPIEVCVGAYQWGRTGNDAIKTAEPEEITFLIYE